MIEIEVAGAPGGTTQAWVARPDGDGPHPGVLLFADAIGLRPQIRRVADRIASWGYVVLAPHLFHRSGTAAELEPAEDLTAPGAREKLMSLLGPRMQALTTDRALADIDDYLTALTGLPGVAATGVGVTGYCMGARLALRAAVRHPELVAACGGFHGGHLVTDAPDSPHLGLSRARAAFVFGHADNDGSMPPEAVAALGEALAGAGLEFSNAVYPGAAHGYVMADTSMYDEAAAERHYAELRELLDTRLG